MYYRHSVIWILCTTVAVFRTAVNWLYTLFRARGVMNLLLATHDNSWSSKFSCELNRLSIFVESFTCANSRSSSRSSKLCSQLNTSFDDPFIVTMGVWTGKVDRFSGSLSMNVKLQWIALTFCARNSCFDFMHDWIPVSNSPESSNLSIKEDKQISPTFFAAFAFVFFYDFLNLSQRLFLESSDNVMSGSLSIEMNIYERRN